VAKYRGQLRIKKNSRVLQAGGYLGHPVVACVRPARRRLPLEVVDQGTTPHYRLPPGAWELFPQVSIKALAFPHPGMLVIPIPYLQHTLQI
jgi:hypothetical protein